MTADINKILATPAHNASSPYGAQMGRRDQRHGTPKRLLLQRVRFVDGDYDRGGAYWGKGNAPLWCAFSPPSSDNDPPIMVFVRADTREGAKNKALDVLGQQRWSFFR